MIEAVINKEKSITPRNQDEQPHGHWITYHGGDNKFWFECYYVNGVEYGYERWHDGQIFYHAI
jgi:hypothetical protein